MKPYGVRWHEGEQEVDLPVPCMHALKDEYFHFAWLLRREAYLRLGYDPDGVFCMAIDEFGMHALIELVEEIKGEQEEAKADELNIADV